MEAIDNNRFFYVSQWKSWLRHTVWRIPFVRSHLQFASANRSQAMDKWINLWQAVEKVALRAAQAALNRLRKKSSRAQEAHHTSGAEARTICNDLRHAQRGCFAPLKGRLIFEEPMASLKQLAEKLVAPQKAHLGR